MDFDSSASAFDSRANKSRSHALAAQRRKASTAAAASTEAAKLVHVQQQKAIALAASRAHTSVLAKHHARLSVPGCSLPPQPLSAYPVHGDGDKIALPVSALESLQNVFEDNGNLPLIFKLEILTSPQPPPPDAQQVLKAAREAAGTDTMADSSDSDSSGAPEGDSDDDGTANGAYAQFIIDYDLSRRAVAFTHAGVCEFSAPENAIGLPKTVADRLIADSVKSHTLPPPPATSDSPWTCELCRTVGIAPSVSTCPTCAAPQPVAAVTSTGKPAFGLFATPTPSVVATLIRAPKGTQCCLMPSTLSLLTGFLDLEDVKLVLEQSLIRTRTTLTVGDTVTVWHKGKGFELLCQSIEPSYAGVVCCIDTNIEVDIGENVDFTKRVEDAKAQTNEALARQVDAAPSEAAFSGAGQTLSSPSTPLQPPAAVVRHDVNLPPEPPVDAAACRVLVRFPGGESLQRRFDVAVATLEDLYALAGGGGGYVLVERFPRKVYGRDEGGKTLEELGFRQSGSVALIVERV